MNEIGPRERDPWGFSSEEEDEEDNDEEEEDSPDLVWKCSDNLEFTCNDPEVTHDTNAAILRSVLAHGPRTWPKTIAAHASNDLTISYHNVKKVLTRVRRKSTAKTSCHTLLGTNSFRKGQQY